MIHPCLAMPQFSPYATLKKISCPERRWVVCHPFVAKRAYRISMEARMIADNMANDSLLDHDSDGGQVDAFRHSYWMACLSQEMCWRKAMRLGRAHERGNYLDFKKGRAGEEVFSDSVANAMDLFNNNVGISIGRKHRNTNSELLIHLIVEKIRAGDMKIIRKDDMGKSLRCDGSVIELEKFAGQWNIPRCLISSSKE